MEVIIVIYQLSTVKNLLAFAVETADVWNTDQHAAEGLSNKLH